MLWRQWVLLFIGKEKWIKEQKTFGIFYNLDAWNIYPLCLYLNSWCWVGLLGSVAPCVLYGSNVERLGSTPGTFVNHCLPYSGLYVIGNSCFGWNCLAPLFSYPSRTALRRRFNLEVCSFSFFAPYYVVRKPPSLVVYVRNNCRWSELEEGEASSMFINIFNRKIVPYN